MKFTRGYAAVMWFEELDQFDGIDALHLILNSLRRGSEDFRIYFSYNPSRDALGRGFNRTGQDYGMRRAFKLGKCCATNSRASMGQSI